MAKSKAVKIVIFVIVGIIALYLIAMIIGVVYVLTHMDEWNSDSDPRPSYDSVGSVDGFEIAKDGNSYAICATDGTLYGDVTLPDTYEGSRITAIQSGAFYDCADITSLTVPDSYTRIDGGAFEGLTGLESLTVPFVGEGISPKEGWQAVLGYPFGSSRLQETFELEDDGYKAGDFVDVDYTGHYGAEQYVECTRVTNAASSAKKSVGVYIYSYEVPSSLKEVTVTKQTRIPTAAFRNLSDLLTVTYEKEVTLVGDYAFCGCASLNSFNSEEDKTVNLGGGAFKEIGDGAFKGCESITNILFEDPEDPSIARIEEIGKYAFKGTGVTEAIVPDTVEKIGKGAFEGCEELVSITLPFLGSSLDAGKPHEKVLGYIFGYTEKTMECEGEAGEGFSQDEIAARDVPEGQTAQYAEHVSGNAAEGYHNTKFYLYYVPDSLKNVTVTQESKIPTAAFRGLLRLKKVVYYMEVAEEDVGECAFEDCGVKNYEKN